jgi:hypothetical protein
MTTRCRGRSQLLISGNSGVGKTALVRETYLPVTRHGAFFFSGKFDLTMRREPFAAWVQIFDKIVDHILAEPDDSLATWRANISAALGAHAVLLTGRSRLGAPRRYDDHARRVQTYARGCRSSSVPCRCVSVSSLECLLTPWCWP